MIYLILIIALVVLIYGPSIWVKYVIHKHSKNLDRMPGTGSELALHLIERFKLDGVTVKKTRADEDYYSPSEKIVGLSPEVYNSKSLSAVAIAAHEVGHAIQHIRNEPVSQLRDRYAVPAKVVQNAGIYLLASVPIAGLISRSHTLMIVIVLVGVITMLASVVFHAMVLPEEFDASFDKALPILNEGYVPTEYMPAVRQVLKACALTYVAGALADVLSIWRWISILR